MTSSDTKCPKSPDNKHLWAHGYPHRDVYVCLWCCLLVDRHEAVLEMGQAEFTNKGGLQCSDPKATAGEHKYRLVPGLAVVACKHCHFTTYERDLTDEQRERLRHAGREGDSR